MNLFGMFNRRGSAPVARERLQILMAHERRSNSDSDLIVLLHKEILDAISKHIEIDADKVEVKMHRRDVVSVLEIDVEIDSRLSRDEFDARAACKVA
jgi:cell division topological specificity factor